MTHTGFKPMQEMINVQVQEMKANGYSDERIFQNFLDVESTSQLLVMVSKALHG